MHEAVRVVELAAVDGEVVHGQGRMNHLGRMVPLGAHRVALAINAFAREPAAIVEHVRPILAIVQESCAKRSAQEVTFGMGCCEGLVAELGRNN